MKYSYMLYFILIYIYKDEIVYINNFILILYDPYTYIVCTIGRALFGIYISLLTAKL